MKRKPPPKKGAAPVEEKTASSAKSTVTWCESCQDRRTAFGGRCLSCGSKVQQ